MVAVRKGFDYDGAVRQGARLRVATKYVNTTREHFAAKGVHVDLIRLYGSMELAPLIGLADAIVDLVVHRQDAARRTTSSRSRRSCRSRRASSSTRRRSRPGARQLQPLIDAFAKAAVR